jgi:hypothetical protein
MDGTGNRGTYDQNHSVACVLAKMGYGSGPNEAKNMGLNATDTEESQRLCAAGYRELGNGNYGLARQYFIQALGRNPFVPGPYEGLEEIPTNGDSISIQDLPELRPIGMTNHLNVRKSKKRTGRPGYGGVTGRPTKNGHSSALEVSLGLIELSLGSRDHRTSYRESPGRDGEGDGSLRPKVYPSMP